MEPETMEVVIFLLSIGLVVLAPIIFVVGIYFNGWRAKKAAESLRAVKKQLEVDLAFFLINLKSPDAKINSGRFIIPPEFWEWHLVEHLCFLCHHGEFWFIPEIERDAEGNIFRCFISVQKVKGKHDLLETPNQEALESCFDRIGKSPEYATLPVVLRGSDLVFLCRVWLRARQQGMRLFFNLNATNIVQVFPAEI